MNSITIITIVVVALLTIIIFGLTWIAYRSYLKAYKIEVKHGEQDDKIKKEYQKKSKGGLLGLISSYVVLSLLVGLFVSGIVYKASGNNFNINNQTALVIKSGSMSDFYNDAIAEEYNNDRHLQFDVGDICIFEQVSEDEPLIIGEVYGYKYKNIIITHRLVSFDDVSNLCKFRGDNNKTYDGSFNRENFIYHYVGTKIPGLGTFVLYAQSYFGIWSLVGIIGVTISSEVVYSKIDKINKDRAIELGIYVEPKKKPKKTKKEKKKHEKKKIVHDSSN